MWPQVKMSWLNCTPREKSWFNLILEITKNQWSRLLGSKMTNNHQNKLNNQIKGTINNNIVRKIVRVTQSKILVNQLKTQKELRMFNLNNI